VSEDPLIGTVLSERYRIVELVGTGAMGQVYRAEHILMRKRVALKVLRPELMPIQELNAQFEREARASAHIEHPHVAAATDFGKLEDGSFFLVLEFIEGKSLAEMIENGPMEAARVLTIAKQIVSALEFAHARGIVHRDLKPDNLLLLDSRLREGIDFVKIFDFGIAKMPIETTDDETIRRAGLVYGTPEYMAPEQALGQAVDGRADLYAVGVIMYEMLTGRRPYLGPKVALLGKQLSTPLPKMSDVARCSVPRQVEVLVAELLSSDVNQRPLSATALQERLEALAPRVDSVPPQRSALPGRVNTSTSRALLFTLLFGAIGVVSAKTAIGALKKSKPPSADAVLVAEEPIVELHDPQSDQVLAVRLMRAAGEGVDSLQKLAKEYPSEGIVLAELALVLSKNDRPVEATTAAREALGLDPKLNENRQIAEALYRSVQAPEAQGTTFRLLSGAMGSAGVGIIYDLSRTEAVNSNLRAHARRLLARDDVLAAASKALVIALELDEPNDCEKLLSLVTSAELVGDKRSLPALRRLEERTGCGPKKNQDCYSCLRNDESLSSAIRTIEQRATLTVAGPELSGSPELP
jgi:serine/threonine protein kinase